MSGIRQWICKGCGQPSDVQCFVEVKGRQQARCPACAEKHMKPVVIEPADDMYKHMADALEEASVDVERLLVGRRFKRRFLQLLFLVFGLALGVLGFLYVLNCLGALR